MHERLEDVTRPHRRGRRRPPKQRRIGSSTDTAPPRGVMETIAGNSAGQGEHRGHSGIHGALPDRPSLRVRAGGYRHHAISSAMPQGRTLKH